MLDEWEEEEEENSKNIKDNAIQVMKQLSENIALEVGDKR